MPSRLPRPSEVSFLDAIKACASGSALLWASSAHASLTISPVSPYSLSSSSVVHYAAHDGSGSGLAAGFLDTAAGFKFIDLTSTSSDNDLLLFDVSSTKSFGNLTSGQDVVVMATVVVNGSTQSPIPIAYAGSGYCNAAGNTRCQALSGSRYYAATYSTQPSNETMRVGIYLKDLCNAPYTSGTISGCTGGVVDAPTAAAIKSMSIRFYVSLEDASGANAQLGKIGDSEENKTITVQLENNTSAALTCPTNLASVYTPGDGEISLNGSAFTTSYTSSISSPVGSLIFLATEGTPTTASFFNDTSQIIARVSTSGVTNIGGFTNTSTGNDHLYNTAIGVRDRAGVVTSTFCSNVGSSTYQVQTSSIRGLLIQSKCFIATAAFGGARNAPVTLLRKFREEVLLRSGAGRLVVDAYYAVSPSMADWLIDNSWARGPVLAVLFWFEAWAWLLLHTAVLASLLALAGMIVLARRSPAIFLLVAIAGFYSLPANAEEEADFSFIEEIKARQKAEGKDASGGSLTEREKARLGAPDDTSIIEEVREERPPVPTAPIIDQQKAVIPPKAEGGAIQAVKSGTSQTTARKDEKSGTAFGFKVWTGGTRDITADGATFYRSYPSLYGSDYTPDVRFFYENQLLQSEWFISLGWFAEAGFGWKRANGGFEFPPKKPDGTDFGADSSVKFTFVTVPVAAGGVARFNLFRLLRPQVKVAPVLVGYFEDRSDSKGLKRGFSRGLLTEAGVAFQLDWIDSRGSWSMYEMFRVKQHFLTLDYQRLDTTQGAVDFSFHGLTLGLLFEI